MSQKKDTYLLTKEQFFGESFADFVKQKKSNNEQVSVTIQLTSKFDEWEIEKYVRKITELSVDEIIISVSKHGSNKPFYKQLKEVHGALHHFATFVSASKEKDYQEFSYNGTRIIFEYYPN